MCFVTIMCFIINMSLLLHISKCKQTYGAWTVLQMARSICELGGGKSAVVHRDLPEDDPKIRQPDISLAREKLAWSPKTGIDEGLRTTLEDFKTRLAESKR